jgi:hypothetical protein
MAIAVKAGINIPSFEQEPFFKVITHCWFDYLKKNLAYVNVNYCKNIMNTNWGPVRVGTRPYWASWRLLARWVCVRSTAVHHFCRRGRL